MSFDTARSFSQYTDLLESFSEVLAQINMANYGISIIK